MSARTFHRASGVVSLSMAEYYLGPASEVSVRHDPRPGEDSASVPWCRPVLLLSLQSNSTVDDFARKIESFYEKDDVFSDDFLTDIIIVQAGNPERTPTVPWSKLQRKPLMGEWSPIHVVEIDDRSHLPEGPYFLTAGNVLAQAWKLYPDSQDAFATTIVPSEEDPNTFKPLDGVSSGGVWRQVAVPSRLYSPVTDKKPLAGLRISIKDNFKIAGVKTTLGNRAFVDTYGPDKDTAVFLQTLIQKDQGVDFHAPFNPRADGYQSPSGSSTGAAASLASYKWLDYSLVTDTTGSIRWPAAWNGFFGFRTTWNAGSLEGVYPSCRHMDALGFLSRDISQLHRILEKSLPALETASEPPKEILYTTDFFPHPNAAQQSLVESFVAVLERHLGILKTDFSIEDLWTESPPEEAQGKTIREYIEKTAYYPFYYDGYNEFSQFRSQYEETHGKPVYVGPYMRWKWDQGAEVRLEQKEKALENEV